MLKPDLTMYFAQMPFIGQYMKYDYECASSIKDMINLFHKWKGEAETTTSLIRRIHFQASANFIYTIITGKSYESKEIELLVNDLK